MTFCFVWVLTSYSNFMQGSRSMFAWSFDSILPSGVATVSENRHIPWAALLVMLGLIQACLVWGVWGATFVQVIVYATLFCISAMSLVGVCAAIVPWRRPELFKSGASTRRVFGIPVVTIAGIGSVASGIFVWFLYLHYKSFGVTSYANMLGWVLGVCAAAVIFYFVVRAIRKSQGINLDWNMGEIPPE